MSSIYLANFKPALTSVTFLADSSPAELYTYWSYSLNGGNYIPFYESSSYRATCTITGLTEGTTYTVRVRAYLSGVGTLYYTTTYSFSTTKSQTAPTVTAGVSGIGVTEFTINGTSNYACRNWEYSLNGGAWQSLSTLSGVTEVSKKITGLSEDTTYSVRVRATRTYNGVTGTSSAVSATTTKNQTPPTISVSITNIGAKGFTINASASHECTGWEYQQIDGGQWRELSASTGTSVSVPLAGRDPATTYSIRVRATRTYNGILGTSGVTSVTTLGPSTLNSANAVTADAETVSVTFNWTVPSGTGFTHTLRIKDGATTVVTVTGLTGTSGSKTISLNGIQRTALLNRMPNKKSFTGTFELETLDGATRVGELSSKTATIITTEANSAPDFTGWSHQELNTKVSDVVSDYMQSLSDIRIVCDTATAKNGASIVEYGATIRNKTVTSGNTTINFGVPTQGGANTEWSVYTKDSRGYTTYNKKNIHVFSYLPPAILEWRHARKDSIGEETALFVLASTRLISGNDLAKLQVRTKKGTAAWTAWEDLAGYYTVGEISSARRGWIYDNDAWKNLDAESSFLAQVQAQDSFQEWSEPITFSIARGIPLVSFRDGKVGINKHDPVYSLDVGGTARATDLIATGNLTAPRLGNLGVILSGNVVPTGGESFTVDGLSMYLVMTGRENYRGLWVVSRRSPEDAKMTQVYKDGSVSAPTLSGNTVTINPTPGGVVNYSYFVIRLQ